MDSNYGPNKRTATDASMSMLWPFSQTRALPKQYVDRMQQDKDENGSHE